MATLCPAVLNQGFCLDNLCQHPHDLLNFCMICIRVFPTPTAYNNHLPHTQIQNAPQWLNCVPCRSYYIQGTIQQTSHENSDRHIRRVAAYNGTGPPVGPIAAPPNSTRCDVCNVVVISAIYDEHCRGNRHIQRRRVRDYDTALRRTQVNQRGVEVSGSSECIDLGTHAPTPGPPNVPPMTLQINYVGQDPAGVSLIHARTSTAVGAQPGFQLRFTVMTAALPLPITLNDQDGAEVQINFNPHGQRGRFEDRLELIFQEPNGDNFAITRPLKAIIGNGDLATLAPTTPYRRPRRANLQGVEFRIIHGDDDELEALQPPPAIYLPERRLQAVSFPENMETVLNQGSVEQRIQAFRNQFMPDNFDFTAFQQHWSNLVHAEHIQARFELTRFDMEGVNLTQVGRLFELNVPGLGEKRPSVMRRDWIMVHPHTEPDDGVWFRGIVHEVLAASVRIRFPASFPYTPRTRYNVRFTLNPVPFRRMLQALSINPKRRDVLFPEPQDIPTITPEPAGGHNIQLHNEGIGQNAEQLQAVRRVLELPPGSPPFIVFGPPGTGKTVTVVECISQILNADKKNRILACAPSNPASDLIASRLIAIQGIQPDRLFRLNAIWRPFITLPNGLAEYSLHQHGTFRVPPLQQLDSYQIIVATCSSAAMLYGVGVDPGSFTHIFIDEAGQGSEPEVMIPILTMAGSKTNIVLSGDPQQLGPVVQSPIAKPLGMETSYLQRLMALPAYHDSDMRGISFAKLLQNFRSHHSILSFPNQQFYGNELIPCAPENIANSLLNWNGLVTPNFPVVFEAVAGQDMQEGNSPSYFNPHEVLVVNEYVQRLLPDIESSRDIGIIAPYKGQVRKIRQLLAENNVTDIEIGSVEQFQGQERRVIIVSTVRSNPDRLSYDLQHTLGFVANRQRLNVAITRAQSLLIVVGDPQVLGLDILWRRFLYYIHASGGWRGSPFPWNPDADPEDAGEPAEIAEQETLDLLRRTIPNAPDNGVDELDQVGNPDA